MYQIFIKLLSESLDYGETLRDICPECESKQRTLSVTKDDQGIVLYQCFRASCSLKGVLGTATRKGTPTPVPTPTRKVFSGATEALSEDIKAWVHCTWGISDPPHWYYTKEYGGRIAMSIRSPANSHRGWVLRNDGSQTPKALTYLDEGAVQLSWYWKGSTPPTILVEDTPSAVRACRYVNAVSLLGTSCGDDKAQEIAEHAPRPIIIALDQDATATSFKLARKYALLWDGPRILPLHQDLKNMKEDELCSLLTSLTSKETTGS